QRGPDKNSGVVVVGARWRLESHAASPVVWSFGVHPCENHPTISKSSFRDGGRSLRILAHDRTPTTKLWAIFPVLVLRWALGNRDGDGWLAYPFLLGGVKTKPHA